MHVYAQHCMDCIAKADDGLAHRVAHCIPGALDLLAHAPGSVAQRINEVLQRVLWVAPIPTHLPHLHIALACLSAHSASVERRPTALPSVMMGRLDSSILLLHKISATCHWGC